MKKIFVIISIIFTLSLVFSISALAAQNAFSMMGNKLNNELIMEEDSNSTILGWGCGKSANDHTWAVHWRQTVSACEKPCTRCSDAVRAKPHSFLPYTLGGSLQCKDCGYRKPF